MGLQEGYSTDINLAALKDIYSKGDGCCLRTGGPKSMANDGAGLNLSATVAPVVSAPTSKM